MYDFRVILRVNGLAVWTWKEVNDIHNAILIQMPSL